LFASDLVKHPVLPRNGQITVTIPKPDPDLLTAANEKVTAAQQKAWQERMIRAWYASGAKLVSDTVRQAVEQW
jgi:hypothetical protein